MSDRLHPNWEDHLSSPTFDVFLSHNHGLGGANHARIEYICQKLRQANIHPWLDTEQIQRGDDILMKIDEGVEHSSIFLAFLTQAYIEKANGRGPRGQSEYIFQEFKAAFRHNKIIIPIDMEPNIELTGYVGTVLDRLLRDDFTSPEDVDENVNGLVQFLRAKLTEISSTGEESPITSAMSFNEEEEDTMRGPPTRNLFQTFLNAVGFGSHSQRGDDLDLSPQELMDIDQFDLEPMDNTIAPFNV